MPYAALLAVNAKDHVACTSEMSRRDGISSTYILTSLHPHKQSQKYFQTTKQNSLI